MKKNGIVSKILIVVMTVMMLASAFTIVSSASSTDRDFELVFYGNGTDYTGYASKDNGTDVYMKCESTRAGCAAWVKGSNYSYGYLDCSDGKHYYFTSNVARFMYSNVYGRYLFARIDGSCSYTSSDSIASGAWSPDSVYENGVLPSYDYMK